MNEKGITVDLSHHGYKPFWEAMSITKLLPIALIQ